MRPLPGTAGGGVCMARRRAISSAARRPSRGRGRRRLRWGRELGRARGAASRGREGLCRGGRRGRAEELVEGITRDGGHTNAAAVVKWNRGGAEGVRA